MTPNPLHPDTWAPASPSGYRCSPLLRLCSALSPLCALGTSRQVPPPCLRIQPSICPSSGQPCAFLERNNQGWRRIEGTSGRFKIAVSPPALCSSALLGLHPFISVLCPASFTCMSSLTVMQSLREGRGWGGDGGCCLGHTALCYPGDLSLVPAWP